MNLSKEVEEELKKKVGEVSGFVLNNGYRLVELEENYCVMEADIVDIAMNPFGMAHGGFTFGLADTAAGVAAMSKGKTAVTVSSTIQYLRPADGTKIKAVAKCLKEGKTISIYEVDIYNEKEVLVAKASVEYFYVN